MLLLSLCVCKWISQKISLKLAQSPELWIFTFATYYKVVLWCDAYVHMCIVILNSLYLPILVHFPPFNCTACLIFQLLSTWAHLFVSLISNPRTWYNYGLSVNCMQISNIASFCVVVSRLCDDDVTHVVRACMCVSLYNSCKPATYGINFEVEYCACSVVMLRLRQEGCYQSAFFPVFEETLQLHYFSEPLYTWRLPWLSRHHGNLHAYFIHTHTQVPKVNLISDLAIMLL